MADRQPGSPSKTGFILLVAGLLLAGWAYGPSLSSILLFDDYAHIAPLYTQRGGGLLGVWEAAWGNNSGPTHRPLAMLSFAAQIQGLGASIASLKWVNLGIHLAVGGLLFLLARRLTRLADIPQPDATVAAAAATVVWWVHPLNLTSVAYAIQRMNSLSALFLVAALLLYVRGRIHGAPALGRAAPWILVLWAAAVLSKENALLLPVYLAVIEGTLLWRRYPIAPLRHAFGRVPRTVWIGGLGLLGTLLLVAAIAYFLPGYAARPFNMAERMLTETRVLWWYIGQLVWPRIAQMGLYHDDFALSTGLWSPPTTLPAVLGLAGLLGVGLAGRKRWPWLAFAILWFLGGHLLESTIAPLELVFEHRNYLPLFGPILAAAVLLAGTLARLSTRTAPWATAAAGLVVGAVLATQTHARAQRWADDPAPRLAYLEARTASLRAQLLAGETLIEQAARSEDPDTRETLIERAEALYRRIADRFDDPPEALIGWILLRDTWRRGPVDPLIDRLIGRLGEGPLSASTINGIRSLTACAAKGACPRVRQRLVQIIDAAAANPTADHVRLLRNRAQYARDVEHDIARAIALQRRAVAQAPDALDPRIELIVLLAQAGLRDEALAELEALARRDRLGVTALRRKQLRLAILSRRLEREYATQRRRALDSPSTD